MAATVSGFNEAGGILPPEWTPRRWTPRTPSPRFNEAGGILPPECPPVGVGLPSGPGASMRPGGFSPRSGQDWKDATWAAEGLQ